MTASKIPAIKIAEFCLDFAPHAAAWLLWPGDAFPSRYIILKDNNVATVMIVLRIERSNLENMPENRCFLICPVTSVHVNCVDNLLIFARLLLFPPVCP